tara:strand:+ start:188 stop:1021 length:834 start_codon:yes stop_codon:yes gene_type:complete
MAYQNVGRCRIYLNIAEYLAVNGVIDIDPVFRTLPVNPSDYTGGIEIPPIEDYGINFGTNRFIAFLGIDTDISLPYTPDNSFTDGGLVNCDFDQKGYAIGLINTFPSGFSGTIGSAVYGLTYTFPTSPDLNLSLSYEYDGVTEITTKGGSTLTNSNYTKPAKWGNLGAWELDGDPKLSRSGRRVWNISFSYMADSEVFPENYALTNENSNDTATTTLLKSNTLQRAIHLTNGHLPFIFQPNTDEKVFAIAKFDTKSFQFNQTSLNTYTVKMTIKEIW